MKPFPPSIIEQAIWLVNELGIRQDQLSPNEYGMIVSNLAMLRMNAFLYNTTGTWEDFIKHIMYPDHFPIPEGMFKTRSHHYDLLLKAVGDVYDKYGEDNE